MSEFNPLVQRVDALLKRHQQQGPDVTLPMSAVQGVAEAAAHEPADAVPVPAAVGPAVGPASGPASGPEDDFPVLTEVVEPGAATGSPSALAGQVEQAVMDKVVAELDRALEHRLGRAISDVLEQAVDGLRADLSASVRETVREAVATALRNGGQDRTGTG